MRRTVTLVGGLVTGLRARAIDVLTVLEAGMSLQHDEAHLEFAAREGRVLYSFNVGDFCRLHEEWLARAALTLASSSWPANVTP